MKQDEVIEISHHAEKILERSDIILDPWNKQIHNQLVISVTKMLSAGVSIDLAEEILEIIAHAIQQDCDMS